MGVLAQSLVLLVTSAFSVKSSASSRWREGYAINKPLKHEQQTLRSAQASGSAGFQATLVAFDVFVTLRRKTELAFLKFAANEDETLFFGFAQGLQACTFRWRLPIQASGAVQQNHNFDNLVSPWQMWKAVDSFALRSRQWLAMKHRRRIADPAFIGQRVMGRDQYSAGASFFNGRKLIRCSGQGPSEMIASRCCFVP